MRDHRQGGRNNDAVGAGLRILAPEVWQGLPVPTRRWIVDGMIPMGQTTDLSGDGGTGKTLLSMQLATACATGGLWLGREVTPCRVVSVFCEDDDGELHRRQDAINRSLGIEFEDLDRLRMVPRIGDNNALVTLDRDRGEMEPTAFFGQVTNLAIDHGAGLVILDARHDLFTLNEVDRVLARQFIQCLTQLARDIDGAVVLCSHPSLEGRRTGTGESGSTAWSAAVRSRLYLRRPRTNGDEPEDRDARVLEVMKANYAGAGDQIKLTWRDGVFTVPERPGGIVGAINERNVEALFLDLLSKTYEAGRTASDKPRSSNYAPAMFARHPNRQGHDRREFERAMESLFAQNHIKVESYGDRPSRQFQRIVACEPERLL